MEPGSLQLWLHDQTSKGQSMGLGNTCSSVKSCGIQVTNVEKELN